MRGGRKPALALWMLIAVADLALVVAAIGAVAVLSVLAGLLIIGTGVWQLHRHGLSVRRPAPVVARRRSQMVGGRRI
jgi:uncharacterized protein (DUF58 family)